MTECEVRIGMRSAGIVKVSVVKYAALIILVALGAVLLELSLGVLQTKRYTSTAFLKLDEKATQHVDALMRSAPLLDRVLDRVKLDGRTIEERRRTLSAIRNLQYIGGGLARMEVTDIQPTRSQQLSNAFIDCYLEFSKPGPITRADLEEQIARREKEVRLTSAYIERLDKPLSEIPAGLLETSRRSQTPAIVALLNLYENSASSLQQLKYRLGGESREVLLSEPTLPEEPRPRNSTLIWLVLAAELILLLWIFLREKLWVR